MTSCNPGTTGAPFRETAEAIEAARAKSILAVEMEAAALYTSVSWVSMCFASLI
jgi:purine-nucleoside phosphorylase